MRRLAPAIAAVLVLLTASVAVADVAWDGPFVPIPGPVGGNPAGDFEQRTGTMPDGAGGQRKLIEFRFVPKPGGVTCAKTAIVQTYSEFFINQDGTVEVLSKPSDYYKVDPPEPDEVKDARDRKARYADPNTVAGITVDGAYSDKDPYYNGDDPADQPNLQGTPTTSTSIIDGPLTGDAYFSGIRQIHVINYEVCAYCMNPGGTLGPVLGCMTWRYVRTKNGPMQIISPLPNASTLTPSAGHTNAVDRYVGRHTRTTPAGTFNYCPEWVQDSLDVATALNAEMQTMGEGPGKDALRTRIANIMTWVRGQRGP
jgi:hypothetical protein